MSAYEETAPNPGLLPYRVGQLESFRRDTEQWRLQVDEDRSDLKHVRDDLNTIKRVAFALLIAAVTGTISLITALVLYALST